MLVGSLGFLVATCCAYRLSRESGNGRYWLAFVVAGLGLGIHQWIKIPIELELFGLEEAYHIISEVGEIVGAIAFAYASYGLCVSMKAIRRKMDE